MHYTKEDIKAADNNQEAAVELFRRQGYKITYINTSGNYKATEPNSERSYSINKNNVYDFYSGELIRHDGRGGLINAVQELFNLTFPQAVAELQGNGGTYIVSAEAKQQSEKRSYIQQGLKLPYKIKDKEVINNYLINKRGIAPAVLETFEKAGLVFASKYGKYVNVCFAGKNYQGEYAFCSIRSTSDERSNYYRGNAAGSDKRFPFRWKGLSDTLFVFEAPIDLMSFVTLLDNKNNWQKDSYIALAGVDTTGLRELLEHNHKIKCVYACLDNDKAGREGNKAIEKVVKEIRPEASVSFLVPKYKDWNEDLQYKTGIKNVDFKKGVIKTNQVSFKELIAEGRKGAEQHNAELAADRQAPAPGKDAPDIAD